MKIKTKVKRGLVSLLVLCLLTNTCGAYAVFATNAPPNSLLNPGINTENTLNGSINSKGDNNAIQMTKPDDSAVPITKPDAQNIVTGVPGLTPAPTAVTPKPTPVKTAAEEPNQLPTYGRSNDTFKGLGFEPQQQNRVDPDGNELDKNTNPFGTNSKEIVKRLGIACAGDVANGFRSHNNDSAAQVNRFGVFNFFNIENEAGYDPDGFLRVANDSIATENRNLFKRGVIDLSSESDAVKIARNDAADKISKYLVDKRKIMAAADMSADGFEEILTVALEKGDKDSYQLMLAIADSHLNGQTAQQILKLPVSALKWSELGFVDPAEGAGIPVEREIGRSMQFKKHFRVAACNGKVAILVNRTVYDFKITLKDGTYAIEKTRECTFNESNKISPISNTDLPVIDIKAEDVNEDSLKDLIITTGSDKGTKDANLVIFPWEEFSTETKNHIDNKDFEHPYAVLKLFDQLSGSKFKYSGVTVGNITGKSKAILVGGYTTDGKMAFLTFGFNRNTNSFDYEECYFPDEKKNAADNQVPELIFAKISPMKVGSQQTIVYNTKLYKYNKDKKKIELTKDIASSITHSESAFRNSKPLNPVVYDTVAGKFFGDKEQIFMLYQGKENGYGSILICEDENGKIKTKYSYYCPDGESSAIGKKNYDMDTNLDQYSYYPAYCAIAFEEKTSTLKFKDAFFAMSDPKVVAVLSAPPYYKELESEYGGGLGNAVTTFGTSKTRENGSSGTFAVTAQTVVGFETEVSAGLIVSEKIASFETTVTATAEFTSGWSKTKAFTTSQSFSAVGQDMVVLTSVPYDVYQFEIVKPGEPEDGATIQVCVPYSPQLSQMNLEDYNKMIDKANSENAFDFLTRVPEEILNHTVGDPRTYAPKVNSSLRARNIVNGDGFLGVGTGDGVSSQSISVAETTSKSFETSVSLDIGFKATVLGVIAGGSVGGKWGEGIEASLTKTQDISGAAANLPPKRDNYYFQWELVGFKCPLNTEESCYVVNYLIKPQGVVPPAPPTNISMLKYNNTSVTLGWDRVEKARQYQIYRSNTKDINTKIPYATIEATTENPVFIDTKLVPKKTYYYAISSVSNTAGKPGDPLAIPTQMTELSIKKQPKLDYTEGDLLDLTGMVLEMTGSDDSTSEINYKDFYRRGIILNVKNQMALTKEDDELSVIITDPLTGLIGITDPIAVKARVSDTTASNGATSSVEKTELIPLDVKTSFTVGGTQGASALMSSSFIEANTTIQNKQKITRPVIVVMAEYNVNGAMIHMDYSAKVISAGATETIRVGGFQLPYNINGHVVKVFVIDGEDFDSSSLIPISAIEQIQ